MDVFLIASATTAFRRFPDRTHSELAEEAYAALHFADGAPIDRIYFGNCALHLYGQGSIRGQAVLGPTQRRGELSATAPIFNVEGGCATGGIAFQSAVEAVRAGASELALAIGIEKTFHPEPAKILELFGGGIDRLHPDEWARFYARAGAFAPDPQRIVFLDVAALQASWHMRRYGTTEKQLATIAAKNHAHGVHNDKAQYRTAMSVDEVLADKIALAPFRRSMCAPISDGAAAALVCSATTLATLPAALQRRAVRVASIATAGGRFRALDEPSVSARAAEQALTAAGRTIGEIDVIELHDATAFAELHAYEELGLCAAGEGGKLAESGATTLGGTHPVNLSGGLESKGHPLAATGLAMIAELHTQLVGGAGARQVKSAKRALFHNAGGQVGFDEALAVVGILEAR